MRASAILEAITEALTAAELDLKESPWVFDQFGKQPRHCVHLGFALAHDEGNDAQGRRQPGQRLIQGPLVVRIAHRIRGDSAPADVRASHDLVEDVGDVLDLMRLPDAANDFQMFPDGERHRMAGDGTFRISDLTYQIRYLRESKVAHP